MDRIILFTAGAFIGSLIASLVLCAVITGGMAGRKDREWERPDGKRERGK